MEQWLRNLIIYFASRLLIYRTSATELRKPSFLEINEPRVKSKSNILIYQLVLPPTGLKTGLRLVYDVPLNVPKILNLIFHVRLLFSAYPDGGMLQKSGVALSNSGYIYCRAIPGFSSDRSLEAPDTVAAL